MASSALASCSLVAVPTSSVSSLRRGVSLRTAVARPISTRAAPLRLAVRASEGEAPAPLQTPPDFGKGGKGSFFGFGPKQELNVGRLAMIGFASALVMEVVTGKGVLGQLGLDPLTVRYPFLFGFLFLFVGGLLGGYVVINNPPDYSKAPANAGEGLPRNPFDKQELDRLPTFTRGGIVDRDGGQKGREPYVSDLTEKK